MILVNDLPAVDSSSQTSLSQAFESSSPPLSLQLRDETVELHREAERKLGLPGTVTNLAEYTRLLRRFYVLYRPLETRFTHLTGWMGIGIEPSGCAHSLRLAADLKALGIAALDLLDAPRSSQPLLVDFAHALGVMYVVEGSTLGSQVILPHLIDVLGDEIANAHSFFLGRGTRTGAFWSAFRISIDRYGAQHPDKKADVISGAKSAFRAISAWMQP